MNVSRKADADNMTELERNDPASYDRILKNMLMEQGRLGAQNKPSEQVELRKAA
jgi:hypothetical protein